MRKRKKPLRRTGRRAQKAAPPQTQATPGEAAADAQIAYGGDTLHQLFAQQTRSMLDRTDLDEEQKQSILAAMSCPCCGAGAMSYTVKLRR